MTYPEMTLTALMTAITMIQIKSHAGICRTGSSFIRHATTITRSAAVSSFDPSSLTVPVLRATAPSIMSLSPAAAYRA